MQTLTGTRVCAHTHTHAGLKHTSLRASLDFPKFGSSLTWTSEILWQYTNFLSSTLHPCLIIKSKFLHFFFFLLLGPHFISEYLSPHPLLNISSTSQSLSLAWLPSPHLPLLPTFFISSFSCPHPLVYFFFCCCLLLGVECCLFPCWHF